MFFSVLSRDAHALMNRVSCAVIAIGSYRTGAGWLFVSPVPVLFPFPPFLLSFSYLLHILPFTIMLSLLLDLEIGVSELFLTLIVCTVTYLGWQWWRAKQVSSSGVSAASPLSLAPIPRVITQRNF